MNNEKQRVQWLKEYELSNMFDSMKGPQKVVQNACGFPFQSPLSETGEKASKLKKKYKFVSFVDLSPFTKKVCSLLLIASSLLLPYFFF